MARIEDFLNRQYGEPPKQKIGIGGFTTWARVEEKTTYKADAPMTPVEDGTFVGDHIINDPKMLSIQGDVSDVYVERSPIISDLLRTQAQVGAITQYAPPRTQAQVQQVNAIANDISDAVRRADALLSAGEQALKFLGNQDADSKGNRERFVDAMESIHNGKQLISIDTEFRRYNNMVITLLEIRRNNQSEALSFSMEAMEFRFSSLVYTELAAPDPSPALNGQTAPEVSKGVQDGEPADASLLFTLIGR